MESPRQRKGSMSDPKDTLYRQITLLQLIPRYPGHISTPVLIEKLKEWGLSNRLSYYFPLICHDEEKWQGWRMTNLLSSVITRQALLRWMTG